jgi:hypothetical protein
MTRIILALAAAVALVGASPAFAGPGCENCPMHKDKASASPNAEQQPAACESCPHKAAGCENCPMHKDKVAATEKAGKKDAAAKCACGKDPKECKCAPGKCNCAKAEKKGATKT